MNILGKLEHKVMEVLWGYSEALKPAEVQEQIEDELAYTTVMTVLKRLVDKGMLNRYKCGNFYCYEPKVSRPEFVSKEVKEAIEDLVDKFGDDAIMQFAEVAKTNKNHKFILEKSLE